MIKLSRSNKRFEAEVNLGLLAIIFVLLFINLAANYVIHNARQAQRDELSAQLHAAAEGIAREWRRNAFDEMTERYRDDVIARNRLSDVAFFRNGPVDSSVRARREWASRYRPTEPGPKNSALVSRILNAEYGRVTSGEDGEFYLLKQTRRGHENGILMVSLRNRLLAYLDSVGQVVVVVSLVAGVLILVLYLLLSRYILSPFRKLRNEAERAGREVGADNDDVEAVVDEYRRIIDELRQTEQDLLRANRQIQGRADSLEQYNEYLLSSTTSGIVSIDTEQRIASINRAASEILAVEPDRYINQPYWNLFGRCVVAVNAISRTIDCGQSQPYQEGTMIDPAGRELTLGIGVSAVVDGQGDRVGLSVVINDLTELASLRRQLEAKNRLVALGEMAGGLAHQLRNSLGAIVGYARLIGKRLRRNGLPEGNVESLQQEASEAESLIERFLYFSRPFDYTASEVNLREFLPELVESIRIRHKEKRILVNLSVPDDCCVEADVLLLKQALSNLVDNAVNAYPDGCGEVSIEAACGDDEVCLSIADNGSGIAREDLERIFTPFYSSRPDGTGLGLPLVNKIVELHGGSVAVDSELGRGTCISLTLPRTAVVKSERSGQPA